jgi:hypothetical protein
MIKGIVQGHEKAKWQAVGYKYKIAALPYGYSQNTNTLRGGGEKYGTQNWPVYKSATATVRIQTQ